MGDRHSGTCRKFCYMVTYLRISALPNMLEILKVDKTKWVSEQKKKHVTDFVG